MVFNPASYATQSSSLERLPLVQTWAARYQPNLAALTTPNQEFPIAQLLDQLSASGRKRTVDQVRRHLKINCELAGLDAHRLFAEANNVINLSKVRHLSVHVERIYDRLLTFYQEQAQQAPSLIDSPQRAQNAPQFPISTLPAITTLAQAIAPLVEELRQAHLMDEDPRTIGFVTTQFHYTTKAILKRLKKWDQVLLYPYLQFAEEQVCIPWQEICEASMRYPAHSPEVVLVEQMLGMSDRIAAIVYQQGRQQLSQMQCSRGDMNNPEVAASIFRDTNMFQGYLWLCYLEGNVSAIQSRLLPLCLMVFPSVKVSWEWVYQMLRMMMNQIQSNLTEAQWESLRPYAESLLESFLIEDAQAIAGEGFHPVATPLMNSQMPLDGNSPNQPQNSHQPLSLEEKAAYMMFQPHLVEETLPPQPFAPQVWTAFQ